MQQVNGTRTDSQQNSLTESAWLEAKRRRVLPGESYPPNQIQQAITNLHQMIQTALQEQSQTDSQASQILSQPVLSQSQTIDQCDTPLILNASSKLTYPSLQQSRQLTSPLINTPLQPSSNLPASPPCNASSQPIRTSSTPILKPSATVPSPKLPFKPTVSALQPTPPAKQPILVAKSTSTTSTAPTLSEKQKSVQPVAHQNKEIVPNLKPLPPTRPQPIPPTKSLVKTVVESSKPEKLDFPQQDYETAIAFALVRQYHKSYCRCKGKWDTNDHLQVWICFVSY